MDSRVEPLPIVRTIRKTISQILEDKAAAEARISEEQDRVEKLNHALESLRSAENVVGGAEESLGGPANRISSSGSKKNTGKTAKTSSNGKHWTQKPGNKAKKDVVIARMILARHGKAAFNKFVAKQKMTKAQQKKVVSQGG